MPGTSHLPTGSQEDRREGTRGQVWGDREGIHISGRESTYQLMRVFTAGASTQHSGFLGCKQQKLPLANLSNKGLSSGV